jgi:hypothetical protein
MGAADAAMLPTSLLFIVLSTIGFHSSRGYDEWTGGDRVTGLQSPVWQCPFSGIGREPGDSILGNILPPWN